MQQPFFEKSIGKSIQKKYTEKRVQKKVQKKAEKRKNRDEHSWRKRIMKERKEVLDYGMTLPDVYIDAPFHDDNWILLRYKKNKRAFAWTYERNGKIWVNVKVDPEWRDFWRNAYASVLPGYHQNKEHWNSVILDGSIPDQEIKRMIAESYDLIVKKEPSAKGGSPKGTGSIQGEKATKKKNGQKKKKIQINP